MKTQLGYKDAWIELRGRIKIWIAGWEGERKRAESEWGRSIANTRIAAYECVLAHMMWEEGCLDCDEMGVD